MQDASPLQVTSEFTILMSLHVFSAPQVSDLDVIVSVLPNGLPQPFGTEQLAARFVGHVVVVERVVAMAVVVVSVVVVLVDVSVVVLVTVVVVVIEVVVIKLGSVQTAVLWQNL
jgi:hypothetical protein